MVELTASAVVLLRVDGLVQVDLTVGGDVLAGELGGPGAQGGVLVAQSGNK